MSSLSFCIPTCPLIQCYPAETTFSPSSQVTDQGTVKYQPQYWSPRSTTCHWCLGRQWNRSHCPLSSIVWPIFMSLIVHLSNPYPSYLATNLPSMVQNVENSVKISAGCPPTLQSCTLQHRGHQVSHQWPALLPPLSLYWADEVSYRTCVPPESPKGVALLSLYGRTCRWTNLHPV